MWQPRNKLEIALLLLIRDLGPINFQEIADIVRNKDDRIPTSARKHLSHGWSVQTNEVYLRELIASGLIATQNGEPYAREVQLISTPALGIIQDLFSIGLNRMLTRDDGVEVHPTFGQPLANDRDGAWAQIFVAMPFIDALRPVYADHIKTVTDALGLTCKRGDDFFTTNRIMDDVWSAIYHADLCIVDCTGRNPNVFYELGIAHTLGRKAVLIAQTIDDIPFDVRDRRIITYEYTPPGMVAFEEKLKKTLQAELGLQA